MGEDEAVVVWRWSSCVSKQMAKLQSSYTGKLPLSQREFIQSKNGVKNLGN